MPDSTILWFDFETFGSLPRPWDGGRGGPFRRRDRPAQFGAIRTTEDLQPIGDPIEIHCRPSEEEPPSIGACRVTGIVPQDTVEGGLPEHRFMEAVLEEMSVPRTTCTGWNNFGYDDEIVRFGAWRNLLPPYDREWRDGNARFDLLSAFRLAWTSGRRDGIEWPTYDDGAVSLRLEDLAEANGLDDHADSAHDALGDVRATIALAERLKAAQPRLWSHARSLSARREVESVVDDFSRPFLLSGSGFGAARGHGTVAVMVLNPGDKQRVLVDLASDPEVLLDLDPRTLHARFHSWPVDPEERIPVRRLRVNQVPMVAPTSVLRDDQAWTSLGLDRGEVERRLEFVTTHRQRIAERLRLVLDEPRPEDDGEVDVEERLYEGFVSDTDLRLMRDARHGGPDDVRRVMRRTSDDRVEEIAFRYLGRVHPDALDEEERARWIAYRRDRLLGPGSGDEARILEGLRAIESARGEETDPRIADEVERWTLALAESSDVTVAPDA